MSDDTKSVVGARRSRGRKLPPLDARGKKLTVRELFVLRLKREGRFDRYESRVASLKEELRGELRADQIERRVSAEFGYVNSADERRRYREHLLERRELRERTHEARASVEEESRVSDFSSAFRRLPKQAERYAELNWVFAHEALTRKLLDPSVSHVALTAEDVLYADHGAAPSRNAATMLAYWANKPEEFFAMFKSDKTLLMGDKGGVDEDEDAPAGKAESVLMDISTRCASLAVRQEVAERGVYAE